MVIDVDKDVIILEDIKSKLGVDPDDDSFDEELYGLIISTLGELNQVGIGIDESQLEMTMAYSDFFKADENWVTKALSKEYIKLNVKSLFDVPASGAANTNMTRALDKLLWRAQMSVKGE